MALEKPQKRELIRNPKTVKDLANELKDASDLYWCGDLSEVEYREYVCYVAKNHKLLANNGKDLNSTVKTIVGVRRTELINKMLEGYQIKL